MGRATVIFKCVIDKYETATHGPTCGKAGCERLFKCIPVRKQVKCIKAYTDLRALYNDNMIEKYAVKDEIETMQWVVARLVEKHRREARDRERKMHLADSDDEDDDDLMLPVPPTAAAAKATAGMTL